MKQLASSPVLEKKDRLVCSIEFTNACNFRCPICPQAYRYNKKPQPAGASYDRKIGLMEPAVFDRVLEECKRIAKTVELNFFGEQTLHPDYFSYIERLAEIDEIEIVTNTNVSLVTKKHMRLWIDSGLHQVRFSLDALSDQAFEIARPGKVRDIHGLLNSQVSRIDQINEKLEYWFDLPDHSPTRIVFVESQYNKGEADKFVEYWQPKLGSNDHILVKPVISYGGKISDPSIKKGRCNIWDIKIVNISWDGRITPCNLDTNMDLSLGNIMNKSIYELYFEGEATDLRGKTGCGNDLTPCRTCTDSNYWVDSNVYQGG